MRWDYLDPPTPTDREAKARALAAIERWWSEFACSTGRIDACFRREGDLDLAEWMKRWLGAVHPELCWEFGPAVRGKGHRLVITPEADKELRPMVRSLLGAAPQLPGWEFYGYRLPEPNDVHLMIGARTELEVPGLVGRAAPGDGNRIDVRFACPGFPDLDDLGKAAFVASETLFGEEALDRWIGIIEAVEYDPELEWLDLPDLGVEVDRIRAELLAALPRVPLLELRAGCGWHTVRLKPREGDPSRRGDMMGATTRCLEVLKATHSRSPFYSGRFSRVGETFCYLQLERGGPVQGDAVERRGRIEDALDAALASAGLGCCIGGGEGLHASYVDLALTDVARSLPVIQAALRGLDVPRQSRLLFFDDELRAEWVGIWPETPPPTRAAG